MRKLEYKWIALLVTTIGSMMVAIDSTIVILGLPDMLQDLHSNLVRMTWVLMAYLLVSTVLLLTFGRMADMFGRVRMYNLGFIIFTIGSVACGLAVNDTMLIASRVLQGLGGAMLSANAMAIITEVFPSHERGMAMGFNAVTWGAGSVLGPVLGGVILAFGSWRWIFLVNLPIASWRRCSPICCSTTSRRTPKASASTCWARCSSASAWSRCCSRLPAASARAGSRRRYLGCSRWRSWRWWPS